jgi:hypothetical protein
MPKTKGVILRILVKIGKGLLAILAIPAVRNFLWDKAMKSGKSKIIDAESKVIEKPKKRLFRK